MHQPMSPHVAARAASAAEADAGHPLRPSRRGLLRQGLGAAAAGLGLLSAAAPARAATTLNGLWSASSGDYLVLLQDAASGQTFGLQVPATLDGLKVWLGSGSSTQIALQGLTASADTFSATISNGQSLSGTQSLGGVTRTLNASLALAWVATEYAGVWQKASPANAYLVFCVLNTGNGRLALQIDVSLAADKSVAYDIFTGTLTNTSFVGLSIAGSGQTSRLSFNGKQLQGSLSAGRASTPTTFSATQIVQIGA